MIVKFLLNGLAVRKEIPSLQFDLVKSAAAAAHPTAASFAVAFEDEDGDMVRIASQDELTSAMSDPSFKPRFHLIQTETTPVAATTQEQNMEREDSSGATESPASESAAQSSDDVSGADDAATGQSCSFDADSIESVAQALQEFIQEQRHFVDKLPVSSVAVASAFDAAEKCLSETLRCCATPMDASLNAKEAAGNVLAHIAEVFKTLQGELKPTASSGSDSDDSAQIVMPVALTTPVVKLERNSELKWPELKLYLDSMKPLLSHPRFASFVSLAMLSVEGLAGVCQQAAGMKTSTDDERSAVASFVIDSGVVMPVLELFIIVFGDIGSSAISCNQDLLLRAGFSADEIHSAIASGTALHDSLCIDEHAPESTEAVNAGNLVQLLLEAASAQSDAPSSCDDGGAAAGGQRRRHGGRGRRGGCGRGRGRRHGCHRSHSHERRQGRCGSRGKAAGADTAQQGQVEGESEGAVDCHHGRRHRGHGRRRCFWRRDDRHAAAAEGECDKRQWRQDKDKLRGCRRGPRFWERLAAAAQEAHASGGSAWFDAMHKHMRGPSRWQRRQAAMAATQPQPTAPTKDAAAAPASAAPDADDMLIQEAIRQSLDMRRTMAATPTAKDTTVNSSAPMSALETEATPAAATAHAPPAISVALQRLPAGSSFAGDELSAKFVSHLTVADHNAVSPASTFIKAWRVQNTSRIAWPEGVRLVCVGGHPLGLSEEGHPVPAVAPGDTVDISVKLTAPPYPGRNVGYFRLVTADGTRFGHRLWCDLVVDNSNVASVLKALRESGSLPGSTNALTQTSPRADSGAATPVEQDGYVVVPSADKLPPAEGADKRVSLRARARGRSGTGSSVATFDGAQGSASMEASMSDCGTPGASDAHRATPALDAATPVTESALAAPTAAAAAESDAPAVPAHMAQYAVQLQSMRELGFEDEASYPALVKAKGNVSAAVQALFEE